MDSVVWASSPNERIHQAVHIHKNRPKEVACFVALECSAISSIAKRTTEAKKHKNEDVTPITHVQLGGCP